MFCTFGGNALGLQNADVQSLSPHKAALDNLLA